jgi:hypothetical protein
MSGVPPGKYGTTILTGPSGKTGCAEAPTKGANVNSVTAEAKTTRAAFIRYSPYQILFD